MIVAGFAVVSQLVGGAINERLVALTALALLVPALSIGLHRRGWPWGPGIGATFAVALAGLGALWEWFMWIGDVQGTADQKLDAAWSVLSSPGSVLPEPTGWHRRGRAFAPCWGGSRELSSCQRFSARPWSPPTDSNRGSVRQPRLPTAVRDRVALPNCGSDALGPGDEPMDPGAHECLLRAFQEGRPSELRIDRKADDGQPVTDIIRALDDGSVEVFRATGPTSEPKLGTVCPAPGPARAPIRTSSP